MSWVTLDFWLPVHEITSPLARRKTVDHKDLYLEKLFMSWPFLLSSSICKGGEGGSKPCSPGHRDRKQVDKTQDVEGPKDGRVKMIQWCRSWWAWQRKDSVHSSSPEFVFRHPGWVCKLTYNKGEWLWRKETWYCLLLYMLAYSSTLGKYEFYTPILGRLKLKEQFPHQGSNEEGAQEEWVIKLSNSFSLSLQFPILKKTIFLDTILVIFRLIK